MINKPRRRSSMDRMISYSIGAENAGMPIDQFLKSQGYSSQNLTEIKRMPKSILVNGEHYYMRQILKPGDHLQVCIHETAVSEKIPPVRLPLHIVYEDEDLLVINKPAGMPIHPSLNHYENSLANALAWYFKEQDKPFVFRCSNRLDRDTSGLTIIAKHLVSGSILSDLTARREIHREYLAICRGTVTPSCGTIDAPISRTSDSIIERMVNFETGESARTHYQVIANQSGHSLVRLQLETGRTHQIRVHMKYLGFPLIGDSLYHPDMEHMQRQALHSYHMSFPHPITKEPMEFFAPLPEDMKKLFPDY